jgi:hypothetical protein
MLRLEDCIALCGLTPQEIDAVAEHERIPQMAALELGHYLAYTAGGEPCIKTMIRDDILAAQARGDVERTAALKLVLRNFVAQHPLCDERRRAAVHVPERRGFD